MSIATILVRGPNWVGDLVMSTPGFRALRAAYPDARIVLQLRPGLAPLLAGAPWFDEVRSLESYHLGLRALLREAALMRADLRYDLGLCLPDSFSSALLMRVAGVRRVVGYRRSGRALLLHSPVSAPPAWGRRRMVARERFVLDLVRSLGCDEKGTQLELFTTAEEEEESTSVLGMSGVTAGTPYVAIAPGASYGPSKLWPVEHFARVGDALADRGLAIAIVGSSAEAALGRAVCQAMHSPAAMLAGTLGLGALKPLLRGAHALVCNDAGARHIAVAFGVPCVVMMGPTSLDKTDLNLGQVDVLTAEGVDCRPCYSRNCPIDHRCMTRIRPERVLAAIEARRDPSDVVAL